jgi:hypothetical protein
MNRNVQCVRLFKNVCQRGGQVVGFWLALIQASTHSLAAVTVPSSPAISISGTMDSQPFMCRGIQNFTQHFDASHRALQISFECNGSQLSCLAQNWRQNEASMFTDCYTPSPTGSFAVAHLPTLTTISPGQTANLLVQVYNNTGKALSTMTVASSNAPRCNAPARAMSPGAVVSFECSTPVLSADTTDVLTVSATASDGTHFSGTASSAIRVDNPRLSILVRPPQQNIAPHSSAGWTIRVANTGPATLTSGVYAEQRGIAACGATTPSIAAGGYVQYACGQNDITSSFTDQFSASVMSGSSAVVVDQTVAVSVVGDEIFKSGFEFSTGDEIFKGGFER